MGTARTTRAAAGAAALLLLFGGCSDPQGTEPGDAAASAAPDATSGDPSGKGSGGEPGRNGPGGAGKRGRAGGSGGRSGTGGPGDGGAGGGGDSGGGGGGGGASADYPAAGEYVYDQEGFERFCQGPSCSKEDLPPTQTVTATVQSRSAQGTTIVTEARSSESQTLTTTTRYTRARALITRVDVDYSYGGFSFAQTYDPQPPVESLLFPLEVGKSWRGRWKARTSGDYRIRVVGTSSYGGRTVYELTTVTNFRGDFSGRAQATVWVDPDTRMPVKTDGQIAVASPFGEYTSDFETTLRSGPGY